MTQPSAPVLPRLLPQAAFVLLVLFATGPALRADSSSTNSFSFSLSTNGAPAFSMSGHSNPTANGGQVVSINGGPAVATGTPPAFNITAQTSGNGGPSISINGKPVLSINGMSGSTNAPSITLNGAPFAALGMPAAGANPSDSTNAAPEKHGITITADTSDDDDSDGDGKKHSDVINIGGGHDIEGWSIAALAALMIPILGVLCLFGMPVLIVFVVCYFKYRRRQESLATVREYLNKGLPVPPELLAEAGSSQYAAAAAAVVPAAAAARSALVNDRAKSDLRKGLTLASIGLGLTLALYVDDPHGGGWGWGLIPFVMGIGYILSGWFERRDRLDARSAPFNSPPPGNPPPPPLQ
jgi:hypothetical protein